MDNTASSAVAGILGLGVGGLIIGFLIWMVCMMVTGYFLGVGMWSAMPREVKTVVRRAFLYGSNQK